MKISQEQELKLIQKVTPQLITTQKLLQIPAIELSREIEKELQENPALEEEIELKKCPFCEIELQKNICPECGYTEIRGEFLEYLQERINSYDLQDEGEISEEEKEISQFFLPPTLRDYLKENFLLLSSTEEEKRIAEILIENINEYGYLTCETSSISSELKIEEEKIEKVLKKIQSIEPPGIGSRNVKECLLSQLEYLEKEGRKNELSRKIVENYLPELAKQKYEEISQKLNVTKEELNEAIKFIQENLSPHPGLLFRPPLIYGRENTPLLIPDVVVEEKEGEVRIEVVEFNFNLRINPYYLDLYEKLKDKKDKESLKELEHIKRYILRAKLFLKSIQQRKETLFKIVKGILEYQREFFITRKRESLKPLTQAKLAEILNLSESTISRATANKYIQVPWKEIVPFSFFFDTSLAIKKKISSLIKEEKVPLKDQEIAEILKKEGIFISRRTVAKYREEMNIPAYNLRKKSI